jgi:hypothetical protein
MLRFDPHLSIGIDEFYQSVENISLNHYRWVYRQMYERCQIHES